MISCPLALPMKSLLVEVSLSHITELSILCSPLAKVCHIAVDFDVN